MLLRHLLMMLLGACVHSGCGLLVVFAALVGKDDFSVRHRAVIAMLSCVAIVDDALAPTVQDESTDI